MKNNKIYLLAMVLFFSYLAISFDPEALDRGTAWSADVKITELPADTDPTPDDLVMTVNDPGGSPANRKVTKANWQKILFNSGVAGSIPGTCTEPQTYWATDTDVLYICTALNTWTIFSSGAPTDAHYLTNQAEAGLGAEINLGALTTGLLKITVDGGVATPSTAVSGTDYEAGGTAILKSVIADAGDVLVGTGVATPGVIPKGANNTLFGIGPTGTQGYIANFSFDDSAALVYNVTNPTRKILLDASGITADSKTVSIKPAASDNVTITTETYAAGTYTLADKTSTQTLTGKTIASTTHTGSSNTIKQIKYLILPSPQRCDETGATIDTTKTNVTYGQCLFSASAAYTANFAEYVLTVPEDIDTSIAMKVARFKFQLSGADTGNHCYKIGLYSASNSAPAAYSENHLVNMGFTGDGSGASGDIEDVNNITLTDWAGHVTAGQLLKIQIGRDGGNENDGACGAGAGSTVTSYSGPLVISYGSTQ